MILQPQNQDSLSLRDLQPPDRIAAVQICRDAFNKSEITRQVECMLVQYFLSSCWHTPIQEQTNTLLPVSYFLLVKKEQTIETPIGLTGLYRPYWAGQGIYWLGWFAVDPVYHHRGYGKWLLQASINLARARGGRMLCVETSQMLEPARGLYEAMGFKEFGRVPDYWDMAVDLVILARRLDDK